MGFPVGYTELLLPKVLIHTLTLLGFIRKVINTIFHFLGLPDFLETDIPWYDTSGSGYGIGAGGGYSSHSMPEFHSASAVLIREILPVVKFTDLVDPPDSCAVCLYEFEEQDEIRQLANCRHIFHKCCLDRWMGYDQKTCPLCRTPVIPDDMMEALNERLWAASGIPEFYGEFSSVPLL